MVSIVSRSHFAAPSPIREPRAAYPSSPPRNTAVSSFQAALTVSTTAITFPTTESHRSIQKVRNASERFQRMTNPATRPPIAATTRPIGENRNARLRIPHAVRAIPITLVSSPTLPTRPTIAPTTTADPMAASATLNTSADTDPLPSQSCNCDRGLRTYLNTAVPNSTAAVIGPINGSIRAAPSDDTLVFRLEIFAGRVSPISLA